MSQLLFVSQAMLESWTEQGKIDFQGNVMTLSSGQGRGRSYALVSAARFMKAVGAEHDPNALVGKVKTDEQLRAMGAEQLGDSVVLGDVAYEVQPGFLAETGGGGPASERRAARAEGEKARAAVRPPPLPSARRVSPAPHAPLPRDLEEKREEAEALARFLLENLS